MGWFWKFAKRNIFFKVNIFNNSDGSCEIIFLFEGSFKFWGVKGGDIWALGYFGVAESIVSAADRVDLLVKSIFVNHDF